PALATPSTGPLLPEMPIDTSAAARLREVRVAGRSGSRQQPIVNTVLPTPEVNGRLAGCSAPGQTGPTDIEAAPLYAVARALEEVNASIVTANGCGSNW